MNQYVVNICKLHIWLNVTTTLVVHAFTVNITDLVSFCIVISFHTFFETCSQPLSGRFILGTANRPRITRIKSNVWIYFFKIRNYKYRKDEQIKLPL